PGEGLLDVLLHRLQLFGRPGPPELRYPLDVPGDRLGVGRDLDDALLALLEPLAVLLAAAAAHEHGVQLEVGQLRADVTATLVALESHVSRLPRTPWGGMRSPTVTPSSSSYRSM